MIAAATSIQALKYGFIALIVSCGGYLIASITVIKHYTTESMDDLVYKPQISHTSEGLASLLDKGFEKCLTRPSTTFCLMSVHRRLSMLRSKGSVDVPHGEELSTIVSNELDEPPHQHPITSVLKHFSNFTRRVKVKPMLLEPSILFCMLSTTHKVFLLTEDFNPSRLQGNKRVVTVGIFEEDSKVFDLNTTINVALAHGFQVARVRRWYEGSLNGERSGGFHTIHYFFTRMTSTVHVVVLFRKKNYLWHADLSQEDWGFQDLLYVKDAIFDNFTAIPIETENELNMEFYLPSNPVHFMLQIETSEFHTCSRNDTEIYDIHPSLTNEQLQNRVIVAVQELKAILQPLFTPFWLWAKSLIGWYEECNIFHETSELNLAFPNAKLEGLNLTAMLASNGYLKVVHESSINDKEAKITLDCYGLQINMFVAYQDGSDIRFYVDADGNEHPDGFVYSKFRLCSTDIFGQRVQVPCSPEVIIKSVPLQK